MASPPIRVLVVDDSAFMRTNISRFLESDGTIEVIGQARNGTESIAMAARLEPDVVTMDVLMPGMSGVEALRRIMENTPTPVVMVSSVTAEGTAAALEALEAGAVDFLQKPGGSVTTELSNLRSELIEKVARAAKINRRALRRVVARTLEPAPAPSQPRGPRICARHVICIGISTGGPATLRSLLADLPADLPASVLIAQHMPADYTHRFALNLNMRSPLRVREAREGDRAEPGLALVAPGGCHLALKPSGELAVQRASGRREPTPSVDTLMQSAAAYCGSRSVAVIMTGMGDDGSRGVRAIKKAGGHVIAQDEATSVVYGMPAAALATGCVDETLPVDDIGAALKRLLM